MMRTTSRGRDFRGPPVTPMDPSENRMAPGADTPNVDAPQRVAERGAARIRYNRIARFYDFLEVFDERRFRPWRRSLLARSAGRVLEVGVGTGKNFPYYPARVSITAVDVAEKMLAAARQKAARQGLPVALILADVQDLPFRDDTFDTAVSTFVFCSVPDPSRGLCELRRVVKPAGRILLLEHMKDHRPATCPLWRFLGRLAGGVLGPEIRNGMELAKVRQAGLEIQSIEPRQDEENVQEIVARPNKIIVQGAVMAA